jgi:hypothetical protein
VTREDEEPDIGVSNKSVQEGEQNRDVVWEDRMKLKIK